MSHYVITIKNWDEFNPKTNQHVTKHSWVKIDNELPFSNDMEGLPASARWLWIVLLCHASKRMSGKFEVRLTLLTRIAALEEHEVQDGLEYLVEREVISAKILPPGRPPRALASTDDQPTPADNSAQEEPTDDSFEGLDEGTTSPDGAHTEPSTGAETAHQEGSPETPRTDKIRSDKLRSENTHMAAEPPAGGLVPDLMTLWNHNAAGLVAMKSSSDHRKKSWAKRWRERPDLVYWTQVVKRMSDSSFCCGQNDSGWRADVDFFLRPDTHIKVMEGKYDRGPQARRKTQAEMNSAANQELLEKVLSEGEVTHGQGA